ncbi:hypothetical protein LIER_08464 [Lithospermum erythrorhizon]|uniref:Reverse transcriptase zinc-binding domain-containing protein n=1 Tax=Lithospermum erythrorhizon TaxID=34254 RepID=A0AAV3PD96_LITER
MWGVGGDYVHRQLWEEIRFRRERNRLSTKDRLCSWGMEVDPNYILCGEIETHDHLFFEGHFSAQVWRMILLRLKEYRGTQAWAWEKTWVEQTMGGMSMKQRLAGCFYYHSCEDLGAETIDVLGGVLRIRKAFCKGY